MPTFSIDLSDEDVARWDALAKDTGRVLEDIIRDAILDRLEELDDYAAVKDRLKKPYKTIPAEEVWEQLGLTDLGAEDEVPSTGTR